MKTKAIVTGSFDPITLGHIDVIKKASKMFDEISVVALNNENKTYLFTNDQRKEMLEMVKEELLSDGVFNVIVDSYTGLTADYMHNNGISTIIRGIRNAHDLEYENELKNKMKAYDENFETVFVRAEEDLAYISSTLVRDKINNGEDISSLVPKAIIEYLKRIG